jgi:tetratricopeptide (TPR) repeat protein
MSPRAFASRATFEEAVGLVNAGRAGEAESICREALRANSRDVNMLGLLGAVLVKMNRLGEAEDALRRTIRLAPTFAKPHEDLGYVLLATHRAEEAVQFLKKAVRLDPGLDAAHFHLGRALAALGRGREADEAFEASFELDPVRKALAHAARHHQQGQLEEAERTYRRVLHEHPENVDAMRLLAMIAYRTGRLDDAERLLRRAVSIAPDFTGAIIDLGRVYKEQHRIAQALEQLQRAIALEPDSFQAHYLLGAALAPAGHTGDAIAAYERALEIKPNHAGALLGLGHVLKTVGRQAEAIEAYRGCIRVKPDNGESYWSLANLKTYRLSDGDIADMEAALRKGGSSEQSEVNLLFALAKAYEDRRDFARAWQYYREGNARQRMREPYDPVQTEVMTDAVIEVFDREFLERNSGLGNPDPSPIFVLGLPRSGSTLIEQILASHSMVEGTAELPYLGRVSTSLNRNRANGINYPRAVRELEAAHFRALGGDYLELAGTHRTEGRPRFIDKMPNNFPLIGFIHLILPNAKIIDVRRHPVDACLGCYRQLFAKGQTFTYDLTDLGEYYLQYQRMMDHWHAVLPGRVLTVQYETVVTGVDSEVRRMLEYCALPFEDACLKFHNTERPIRTASSEQVRRPIYRQAVNFSRHYREHLDELLEVLEPILDRYAPYHSVAGDD